MSVEIEVMKTVPSPRQMQTFTGEDEKECFRKIFRNYCVGNYNKESFVVGDSEQNRRFWEWEDELPLDEFLDLHGVLVWK